MITKKLETIKLKDLLDESTYNTNVDIQRDYIYANKDLSIKVIDSIMNNINIATITCWDNKDGTYDVIDGKQRTTTIRQFYDNAFSYEGIEFQNFQEKQKKLFYDTDITICIHSGNFEEKVKCYTQINNGMALTDFEKYYALFHGEYLKGMKEFSSNEDLIQIYGPYSRGKNCIWILDLLTDYQNSKTHQQFLYENKNRTFNDDLKKLIPLFNWTIEIFSEYDTDLNELCYILRKNWNKRTEWKNNSEKICEMLKSHILNKDKKYNPNSLYVYYSELLNVWNKSDLDKRRFFTPEQKLELFQKKKFAKNTPRDKQIEDYVVDHIKPWIKGGKTTIENGQLMLPKENLKKGKK